MQYSCTFALRTSGGLWVCAKVFRSFMPFFRQFIAYLMIAVCFNTAIGVPLHAAEHLKGGMVQGGGQVGSAAASSAAAHTAAQGGSTVAGNASRVVTQAMVEAGIYGQIQADASSGLVAPSEAQPEGGPETAAELCAVCAAYGQSIADFVIWPAAPPVAHTSSAIIAFDAPPPGAAVQWPYSARDPPRA